IEPWVLPSFSAFSQYSIFSRSVPKNGKKMIKMGMIDIETVLKIKYTEFNKNSNTLGKKRSGNYGYQ
ncbi:hypothetical protein, partial [Acidaminococcus sp.]|uniref:hypothetical protein n=1 Tax=Acidaminococcus sp. TaxID=1872103 RepID=UPI003AB69045